MALTPHPALAPMLADGTLRLEPLAERHADGLAAAGGVDRASYAYTWVPLGRDQARAYVAEAVAETAAGRAAAYAVVANGRVVGSTRLWDFTRFDGSPIEPQQLPQAAEIGHTWYAADAQRTGVNTTCKLLLLGHAFDTWQALRVTLKTDARNARSRTAIERLGATFEGIRRAHMRAADGGVRDTAYYSILAPEWPAVRAGLEQRRLRNAGPR